MGWHVVFATPPAPGHVFPTLPLAEELVDRGHRVSYVVGADRAPEVMRAGADVLAMDWQPDWSSASDDDYTVDSLLADVNAYLTAITPALPSMIDQLGSDPPDVICCDSVVSGPLLAGLLEVPVISLVPTLATNQHFGLDRLMPGFDPGHPGLAEYGAKVTELFASYGLPAPGVPALSELTLVFVPREFQIAGDTFDERYRFIGPSVPARSRSSDWRPSTSDPLVLVSLGTAFNDRPRFFTSAAEAFAGTDWQVVMAVGDRTDRSAIGALPPNVTVAASVPQLAVLRHASAFVSHAGMGSVMEALYFQVPVIAVPQVHEQRLNAAHLQELGLGRGLTRDPTPIELRDAVQDLSVDPTVRSRLAAMKHALDAAGGAGAGVDAIERFLASRA